LSSPGAVQESFTDDVVMFEAVRSVIVAGGVVSVVGDGEGAGLPPPPPLIGEGAGAGSSVMTTTSSSSNKVLTSPLGSNSGVDSVVGCRDAGFASAKGAPGKETGVERVEPT